jgi:hypothetical protein
MAGSAYSLRAGQIVCAWQPKHMDFDVHAAQAVARSDGVLAIW